MSRPHLSIVSRWPNDADAAGPAHRTARGAGQRFSMAELLPSLGRLASHVGQNNFYEVALDLIGSLVKCDRRLVVRYSRFDRPNFIVNQSLPDDFIESYLEGLYRFDPLYRVVRSGETAGILTFQQLREDQPVDNFYDEFFASVMIHDELSMMLPAVSGVCIALCFDRSRQAFSQSEIMRLHQLYTLIAPLHRLHIERTVFGSRYASPLDAKMGILVKDGDGRILYSNAKWLEFSNVIGRDLFAYVDTSQQTGVHLIDADHVLHWESVPATNPVAPGGRILIVEHTSPGSFSANVDQVLASFSTRHKLTPRESEIVWLTLRGQPSSRIAERLGLSSGTVRNHRYRLYNKLDITTEREIFSLFLSHMLSNSGA